MTHETLHVAPELRAISQRLLASFTGTHFETLGLVFTRLDKLSVVATMPVGPRVHQPMGLLHGGASVALAESVASIGAWLNVFEQGQTAVGQEINANHVRGVRSGVVTATAVPAYLGRSSHVWTIEVRDERERLVCLSRCTLAIVAAPQ